MAELTSTRKLRFEMRKKQIQEKCSQIAGTVSEFVRENPKAAMAIAVGTASTGAKMVKSLAHQSAVRSDIHDRKTRFYDHSLGCYWHTRRELKPDELIAVQKRRKAGESYGDIFKSMKLLK